MKTSRLGNILCALAATQVYLLPLVLAQPPATTTHAALAKEAGTLADKFTGLAHAMAGKYDWKPGEGVRSAGDVFNLIVTENGMLSGVLSGAGMQSRSGARPAPITDPEKMQEALKTSYANLQKTIEGLSDNDLKAPVKLFGMDMTKEGAIRFLFGDQHEHLG